MDGTAVHGCGGGTGTLPGPAQAAETGGGHGTLTDMQAAAGLGGELVRLMRLVALLKHRVKNEPGAADRPLLARLVLDGPGRATDLAADTLLDLSTVSRQLRSLVDRGLVERHPDPEDRRGSLLSATGAGRAAFEEYRRQRDTEIAAILRGWPAEDRYQLIRLMRRLNDDLMEHHNARHCPGGRSGMSAGQGDTAQ